MPSAPAPYLSPRYRGPQRFAVLLGDDTGARPAVTDVVEWLLPDEIHIGCSSERLDSLFLRCDLATLNNRLQDTSTPVGVNRIIEIRRFNPITGELDECWAWGKLAAQTQTIDGNSEQVRCTARLDHYLFGKPLRGFKSKDPVSGNEVFVERDITFNPEIDGTLFPNRSNQVDSNGACYLLSPESLRSGPARTLQAATVTRMDLASAVHMLCWLMNESETWLDNPTLVDLQAVCGANEILLENMTLERGLTLPAALDRLLERFGFTWFVEHTVDDTLTALPLTSTIKVIERGVGPSVVLRLQRLTDTIHNAVTNLHELDLTYDIASKPNVITGHSALALREGTFELQFGWSPTQDLLTIADLDPADPGDVDVYRKFPLNEGGDYIGRRTEITDAYDLSGLFDVDVIPRRRRFLPALTRGQSDKELVGRNGYYLEWTRDGSTWEEAPWSFSVLDTECGIMIEGAIPEELRQACLAANRRAAAGTFSPTLRITCCIEADFRTSYTADRREVSPNGAHHERDLTLSDKFGDRRVADPGVTANGSIFYVERHHELTGVTDGIAGAASVTIATDLSEWLAEGDRLAIVGSTANDGTYHVSSLSWSSTPVPTLTVNLREALPDPTVDGTLCVLTDEEQPDTKMAAFVDVIQEREDFMLIKASPIVLHGLDRVEYKIGQVIPDIQPRNLSLKSLAASATTQRHPQIVGLRLQFDKQLTSLELEQYQS
jgi:hypothetical protein